MGKQLNGIGFFLLCSEDFKRLPVMTVGKERSWLVPLKAIPTGNPTPLGNAAIEIPPVITVDVIRPVSTIPVIVLNCLIFFENLFTDVNFIKKKCLNFGQFV